MARLGSWDIDSYAPTWFDVDSDPGGVWDRDAIPMAKPAPLAIPFVFQMSGADIVSDLFFLYDPQYRAASVRAAQIELDLGEYGREVRFIDFERRVQMGLEAEAKEEELTVLREAFDEVDRIERERRIRKVAITVGVSYLLLRLWLGL